MFVYLLDSFDHFFFFLLGDRNENDFLLFFCHLRENKIKEAANGCVVLYASANDSAVNKHGLFLFVMKMVIHFTETISSSIFLHSQSWLGNLKLKSFFQLVFRERQIRYCLYYYFFIFENYEMMFE